MFQASPNLDLQPLVQIVQYLSVSRDVSGTNHMQSACLRGPFSGPANAGCQKGDALQRLELVQLDQLFRNMHRCSHRGLLIASDTVL